MLKIKNEIEFSELTPAYFSQILQTYGCITIRSLFTPEKISPITQAAEDLFYIVRFLRRHHLLSEGGEKHLWGGHPANLLPNLSYLGEVLDIEKLLTCFREYFHCQKFDVFAESTGIRYCEPTGWKNYIPWHQDLLDRSDNFLTCWIPLVEIDQDTPAIQFVPKKLHDKLHQQDGVAVTYGDGMNDEEVTQLAGSSRYVPKMSVGDVVLFDPYTAHRSYAEEGMTKSRLSIDIRINPQGQSSESTWQTKAFELPSLTANSGNQSDKRLEFDLSNLVITQAMLEANQTAACPWAAGNTQPATGNFLKRLARRMLAGV